MIIILAVIVIVIVIARSPPCAPAPPPPPPPPLPPNDINVLVWCVCRKRTPPSPGAGPAHRQHGVGARHVGDARALAFAGHADHLRLRPGPREPAAARSAFSRLCVGARFDAAVVETVVVRPDLGSRRGRAGCVNPPAGM